MFKAIALSLTLLFAAPLATQAEPEKGQHFQMMAEKLQLTDEQIEKMRPILEQSMIERLDIMQSVGIGRGKKPTKAQMLEIRQSMAEAREKLNQNLSGILTPKQLEMYTDMQTKMRQKMRKKLKQKNSG